MHRLTLFFILLVTSLSAFAQIDGNYNYSIGVKGYNLVQMPKMLQQTNSNDYTEMWVNGGMLKFNDNQMAFRLSAYYFYKRDLSFNNQCDECETARGNFNDFSAKIGFEKNFTYSVLQPYFAIDLGYRTTGFKGKIQPNGAGSTRAPYSVNTSKNGATLSPVLGLKVNVLKNVSIFAESGLDFFYSYERQETVLDDMANSRTFAKYYKIESLLNPISIGLQIHLIDRN
jgi:hypothetical protein